MVEIGANRQETLFVKKLIVVVIPKRFTGFNKLVIGVIYVIVNKLFLEQRVDENITPHFS